MTYQTKISEEAKRGIRRISEYILEYRAETVLKKIKIDIKKLKDMPYAHKKPYILLRLQIKNTEECYQMDTQLFIRLLKIKLQF